MSGKDHTPAPGDSLVGDMPSASQTARAEDRLAAAMRRARAATDRTWARRVGVAVLAVCGLVGAAWGITALIPRPVPDYLFDDLDDVLDYTLLTKDFNRLPLDTRVGLIKDLVHRLKTMSSSDAAAMAAFAARIQDEARRQLEENAKRLAVDMMDNYAERYNDVPDEERERFLDEMALEFTRMMEDISGQSMGLPADDSARLEALKRQAKRDQEWMRRNQPSMRADRVAGFVEFLQRDADQVASPKQQARMARFMRDATRYFRGQDIDTGTPKPGGG